MSSGISKADEQGSYSDRSSALGPRLPADFHVWMVVKLRKADLEVRQGLRHRLIHNFQRDRRHVTSAMSWQRHEPL